MQVKRKCKSDSVPLLLTPCNAATQDKAPSPALAHSLGLLSARPPQRPPTPTPPTQWCGFAALTSHSFLTGPLHMLLSAWNTTAFLGGLPSFLGILQSAAQMQLLQESPWTPQARWGISRISSQSISHRLQLFIHLQWYFTNVNLI